MSNTFDIYEWNRQRHLNENVSIQPQQAYDLYDFIIKKLDGPARKADLRMSIFEQEFPTASSFYNALSGLSEDIEMPTETSKVDILYTDRGKFYKVNIITPKGKNRLYLDEFNQFLEKLGISDKLNRSLEVPTLDSVVNQLQSKGIEASWDDSIDIS